MLFSPHFHHHSSTLPLTWALETMHNRQFTYPPALWCEKKQHQFEEFQVVIGRTCKIHTYSTMVMVESGCQSCVFATLPTVSLCCPLLNIFIYGSTNQSNRFILHFHGPRKYWKAKQLKMLEFLINQKMFRILVMPVRCDKESPAYPLNSVSLTTKPAEDS